MTDRPDSITIRQFVDGELSPEQVAQFREHLRNHPEASASLEAQVASERALRDRVSKVMAGIQAPAALATRIREAMAQAPATTDDVLARIEGGHVAGAHGTRRKRMAWLGGDRINLVAVAATLALVAGAVLYGIFGPTIDDVSQPPPLDLVSELAAFAGNEHDQCAADKQCLQQRAQFSQHQQAEALLTDWLNAPVRVADLGSLGYDFLGAGRCEMPVDAHSGHLVYRKSAPEGARSPMVSVFVFPNRSSCGGKMCEGMSCGKWYVAREAGGQCKHRVMRSTDGRLVYLLVCCNGRDLEPVAEQIAGALRQTHDESLPR